jgi:hypothetical protein
MSDETLDRETVIAAHIAGACLAKHSGELHGRDARRLAKMCVKMAHEISEESDRFKKAAEISVVVHSATS